MTTDTSDYLSTARNMRELAASFHLALKQNFLLLTAAFGGMLDAFGMGILCFVLGGASWLIERRLSVRDPASVLLLLCGLALSVIPIFSDIERTANASLLALLPLLVTSIFYLLYSLQKQPFAALFALAAPLPLLRRHHTRLWLSLQGLTVAFWWLLPDAAFTPSVVVLALAGLVFHAYLQLVGIGPDWKSPQRRRMGEFRFEQVEKRYDTLKPLYDLFIKEMTPAFNEGDRLNNKPHDEIVRMKMESDQKKWKYGTFFAAYHEDRLVGTISCQLDSSEGRIPVEYITSQPMNLDRMRDYGPVAELGRMSVAAEYRMSGEVMAGLIMCATETALANNACFIVLQAVVKTARMYSKMGFVSIRDEPVINQEYGTPMKLFAINLAGQAGTSNAYKDNVGQEFSVYVLHRFTWRQILRAAFSKPSRQKRVSELGLQELPALAEFP